MADGKKMIARALYDRAGRDEKEEAGEFYDKLDRKQRGKVGLREFQKSVVIPDRLKYGTVFEELSSINKDGRMFMNFHDTLVLFYYNRGAIKILECDDCHQLIIGPSFSSNPSPHTTHTICCRCYGQGNSFHPNRSLPSTSTSAPRPTLLLRGENRLPIREAQDEMKELREIAELHHDTASPDVRLAAEIFFKTMDDNGDNEVDEREFLSFMLHQGHKQLRNSQLFNKLDVHRRGALDFWEVMTVYYVIKSGRPNCDLCKAFIPGLYFACVQCFMVQSSFNLCRHCYKTDRFHTHFHPGGTQYLDNYTLLHTLRGSSENNQQWDDRRMAVGPASKKSEMTKLEVAYKTLELAIAISNTASNIAITAGKMATDMKCVIM